MLAHRYWTIKYVRVIVVNVAVLGVEKVGRTVGLHCLSKYLISWNSCLWNVHITSHNRVTHSESEVLSEVNDSIAWQEELGWQNCEKEQQASSQTHLYSEQKLWSESNFTLLADCLVHFREGVLEGKNLYFTSGQEDCIMWKTGALGKHDPLHQ